MFCTFTLFSCWEEFCLLSLGGVVYFALRERTLHPVPPILLPKLRTDFDYAFADDLELYLIEKF